MCQTNAASAKAWQPGNDDKLLHDNDELLHYEKIPNGSHMYLKSSMLHNAIAVESNQDDADEVQ